MATLSVNRKNNAPMRTGRCSSRNRTREAFRTTKCNPYAFLNEPIKEIACSEIMSEYLFEGVISWESNLLYLEASARKWCELHEKPYEVVHSDNPYLHMFNIYEALRKLTDDYRFDMDFDPKDQMLKLMEYRCCDFPDSTIFYLPAKCLEEYEGDMRELVLRFLSFIARETLYLMPEDCFDFGVLMDVPYDEIEEEGDSMAQMVRSYQSGKANDLFNEILNVSLEKRTPNAIREFISHLSEDDKRSYPRLLECIEKGLKLMTEDDLRNYSFFDGYASDPKFDDRFSRDEIIAPERLFVICYGLPDDDPFAATACYSISEEANNYELQYFRDGRHLSPEDTETFEPSTYPSEWADWFGDFIDIIS